MKKILIGFALATVLFVAVAAVVRGPVTSSADLQIMSGTSVTAADGTITNTFAIAFSAVPNVTCSQQSISSAGSVTNTITGLTTTFFIYSAGKASVTNQWIAVGAP
jgi:hypothetical protein